MYQQSIPTKPQQPIEDQKQVMNQWPNPSMPDPRLSGGQPQPPSMPPNNAYMGYMSGYQVVPGGPQSGQPGQQIVPMMSGQPGGSQTSNWQAMFSQFSNQMKELGKQGIGLPTDYGSDYISKEQGGHNPREDYGGGYKQNYGGGDNRRYDNQGGQRNNNYRQGGGYRDRPQGDFKPRDGGDRRDMKRKSRSRSREKDFHNRGGDRRNDRGDREFDKGGRERYEGRDDRRRDDFRGGDRGRRDDQRGEQSITPQITIGGGQGGEQQKDWRCTKCNNVNWARRDSCNRCQETRPEDAPLVEPRQRPGGHGGGHGGERGGDRGGDRGGHRGGDRGGDRYQHRDQGERRDYKPRSEGPRYERRDYGDEQQ